MIQSLWNLTEDWTPVHETDCIGEIKTQNVTSLGFLTSSTLFSTPRVLRSLKAAESLTPDTNSPSSEVEISFPDASIVQIEGQQPSLWFLHDAEGPQHLHEHLPGLDECLQRHLLLVQVGEGLLVHPQAP